MVCVALQELYCQLGQNMLLLSPEGRFQGRYTNALIRLLLSIIMFI